MNTPTMALLECFFKDPLKHLIVLNHLGMANPTIMEVTFKVGKFQE